MINELRKHQFALSIILLLAYLRFIAVPMIDWQNGQLASIKLLQRQVLKVESVISDDKTIYKQHDLFLNKLTLLDEKFYLDNDFDKFKRVEQKKIEDLLKASELNLMSIGWKTQNLVANERLVQLQLDVGVSGSTEFIIEFLLEMASRNQYHELKTLNINLSRQSAGKLGKGIARIRIAFFINSYADS